MKIRFDHPFKLVTLRDLEPGEMFRNENNEGLFLKTTNDTVVIQKLSGPLATAPGRSAGFVKNSRVVRVKQIIVYPEVT